MKEYYEGEARKNINLTFGNAYQLKENLKKCDLSFVKSIANEIFAFGVYVVDIELTKMGLELGADINAPVNNRPALFQLCSNSKYTPKIKEVIEFLLGQGIDTEVKYSNNPIIPPIDIVAFSKIFMPDIVKTIEDIHSEAAAAAHVPPGGAPFDPVACTGDIESPEGPDLN